MMATAMRNINVNTKLLLNTTLNAPAIAAVPARSNTAIPKSLGPRSASIVLMDLYPIKQNKHKQFQFPRTHF